MQKFRVVASMAWGSARASPGHPPFCGAAYTRQGCAAPLACIMHLTFTTHFAMETVSVPVISAH